MSEDLSYSVDCHVYSKQSTYDDDKDSVASDDGEVLETCDDDESSVACDEREDQ